MKIIHDFLQILLGLIFPGYIGELDAVGGLHIDFGIGFAHSEHHGTGTAAGLIHQALLHPLAQPHEEQDW